MALVDFVSLPVPWLGCFGRQRFESPSPVHYAGAGEDGLLAVDSQLDVGGGHIVEPDGADAGDGRTFGDRQEGLAGDEGRHVDCIPGYGEDGSVCLRIQDIVLPKPKWLDRHGALERVRLRW